MPGFANHRGRQYAIAATRPAFPGNGRCCGYSQTQADRQPPLLPTIREIRQRVSEEFSELGMTNVQWAEDGKGLYMRSIGSLAGEVDRGDALRGGVAVRVVDTEVCVHTYVLRLVCSNGAMMADKVFGFRISRVEFSAPADAIADVQSQVREAMHACSSEKAFARATEQIRSAARYHGEPGLRVLERLPGIPPVRRTEVRREIVARLRRGRDCSLFGVMNAITSVARNEPDPEVRWRLEELGGSVPALALPSGMPGRAGAELLTIGV